MIQYSTKQLIVLYYLIMIKEEASFKASVVVFSERNTHFTVYWNLIMCSFQTLAGYLCLDFCVAISLHYVAMYALF